MTDTPAPWPVLTRYQGERLREIAFPLGGIGTGTLALGGRADLRDVELFNRPAKGFTLPYSFFALRVQAPGRAPATRVLEGALQPPYAGSFGVTSAAAGLPRMREVALEAAYPFARYTLADPQLPLEVALEAFNPLIPLDADRSGLPIAVLRYVLTNPGDEPLAASIAGSLMNLIGTEPAPDSTSSVAARGIGRLLGGNFNEPRSARAGDVPLHGLLMRSTQVAAGSPQDGTLALVALAEQATWRRAWGPTHWNRHLLTFWDDFSDDGRLDDPQDAPASPPGEGQVGSLAVELTVPPRASASCTFLICWHFPHRSAASCGWQTLEAEGGYLGNYYARRYADAWDVALQLAPELQALEAESLRFTTAMVNSTLPQAVKEAALNNISTLRSETCFRTADGNFFGFEGCADTQGCCFGSCTHVWNYEHTTAFLFPELARGMRALELEHGTDQEGMNSFRLRLPLGGPPWRHAAADGQMGVVMKCYREWQLSGDGTFLQRHWPTIAALMRYCWLPGSWDADRDGVMEGVQHNTYDIEFYGPNPLCSVWYLGALRAAEEMARACGDADFAELCRSLFERGSAWIDANLFNGEYYIQRVQTPASLDATRPELRGGMGDTTLADPDFQVGEGCLIDQLAGQYSAHVLGLGYLLRPDHVRAALAALFEHNFRDSLHDHWNTMRTYALADERALLLCSWPHGGRPRVPFPYFSEVMTGFEYQAAVHMIYEGLVEQGLAVIEAVRARFDGQRRNPWNEQECGHHYVRAMAAWAAPLALGGLQYSAVRAELALAPRWQADNFQMLWCLPAGWGVVRQTRSATQQVIYWEALHGALPVARLVCELAPGATLGRAAVTLGGQELAAQAEQSGRQVRITLDRAATLEPGRALEVRI
jgi:uncharacterized protein (DUF608 family)